MVVMAFSIWDSFIDIDLHVECVILFRRVKHALHLDWF